LSKSKSILFLSAIDFKEKSIQVILKTPEAFLERGWAVNYIVARDNSKSGNYFYEREITPKNINVIRFYYPLTKLKNLISNHLLNTIISKISGFLVIIKLTSIGYKFIKRNKVSVLYGYEYHGVLALNFLKQMGLLKGIKTVARYQGTWLNMYHEQNRKFKLLLNLDAILAFKVRTDLCIMTNDGTQGDRVFKRYNGKDKFEFWINGVDEQKLDFIYFQDLIEKYKKNEETLLLSVSRLEGWKRIDRNIKIVSKIINLLPQANIKYLIVGEGNMSSDLQKLVENEGLKNYVEFVGGIPNNEIKKYLNVSDVFFSMYELSNVGNPLLEAIRAHKIIFTLNNGDTSKWIKHKQNGFIYNESDDFVNFAAIDFIELLSNDNLRTSILNGVKLTERELLWTWEERFNKEVETVLNLIK
jgi:glycosyltransferase involved in cell wall biosynthesis